MCICFVECWAAALDISHLFKVYNQNRFTQYLRVNRVTHMTRSCKCFRIKLTAFNFANAIGSNLPNFLEGRLARTVSCVLHTSLFRSNSRCISYYYVMCKHEFKITFEIKNTCFFTTEIVNLLFIQLKFILFTRRKPLLLTGKLFDMARLKVKRVLAVQK